jgi:hypothetical protein
MRAKKSSERLYEGTTAVCVDMFFVTTAQKID